MLDPGGAGGSPDSCWFTRTVNRLMYSYRRSRSTWTMAGMFLFWLYATAQRLWNKTIETQDILKAEKWTILQRLRQSLALSAAWFSATEDNSEAIRGYRGFLQWRFGKASSGRKPSSWVRGLQTSSSPSLQRISFKNDGYYLLLRHFVQTLLSHFSWKGS